MQVLGEHLPCLAVWLAPETTRKGTHMSKIDEKVIYHTHSSHCGGNCVFKLHVREGVVTRIETDDGEEPQYRACARGRAYRQRLYAPDRILYPLKRAGEKGEGKFVRISWDEALDTVVRELKRVKETYGPASILFRQSGGDVGTLHRALAHYRLLCLAGGCSETWGIFSYEAGTFAELVTYGAVAAGSTRDNLLDSRLIIMWGWDPAVTVQDMNTAWYLAQAREAWNQDRLGRSQVHGLRRGVCRTVDTHRSRDRHGHDGGYGLRDHHGESA